MIDALELSVIDDGARLPGLKEYTILLPAELAWSSDAMMFCIAANEGRAADDALYVSVEILEYKRVNYPDNSLDMNGWFTERYACSARDEQNIGAIKGLT